MTYHNIESRRFPGHSTLIGYRKSDGQAVKIYGQSGSWCVAGYCHATLAEVSARLATL